MKRDYYLIDVFTTEKLRGNPLAVVMGADGLTDEQMQRIAGEFNLSETVFVCRAQADHHTAALRIFTPRVELPFAGHPTVGTAVLLGLQHKSQIIRLEEGVGIVTCAFEKTGKDTGHARFSLPLLPQPAGKPPDNLLIATALGIEPEEVGCGLYRPSVASAGVLFYLLPVRDAQVLARVKPQGRGWAEIFPLGDNSVYVYTETPGEPDNDFAARMFSPGMGLSEDPATGAAAAALIGEFAGQAPDGQSEYIIRQGLEIGRLSRISAQFRKDDDRLTHGAIGGHAVIVAQGSLDIDR